jgi:hypothetical protein
VKAAAGGPFAAAGPLFEASRQTPLANHEED